MENPDLSKLEYKAKIEWFKERMYKVSGGDYSLKDFLAEKNTDFEKDDHSPEELISILKDVEKKAVKLEKKIEYLSRALTIPVDKVKNPDVSSAAAYYDPTSGGEFITYEMYKKCIEEKEHVESSISLNDVVSASTGSDTTDTVAIQNLIAEKYSSYEGNSVAKDNSAERYLNRWMNNIVSWNEHDYNVSQILNFADNFLEMNPDPAYIPWSVRREVGAEKLQARSLQELMGHFSEDYASRVGDFVDGLGELRALKPDQSIKDLTTRSIVYATDFLNKMNDVFDISWATDLVCCFMQFGVNIDTKTLKGFRALLQLLQGGISIDFRDVLNGLKDILNNIFRNILTHQLVGLITKIFQTLVDPVKKWLNSPKEDAWNKIFACTPVDELINKYLVEAADYLERLLFSYINNWYKEIEIGRISQGLLYEKKKSHKMIGELAKLIDVIIGVTEAAAKCGIRGSPASEPAQQIINNYSIGAEDVYTFEIEENPNEFNSFGPVKKVYSSIAVAEDPEISGTKGISSTATLGYRSQDLKKMRLSDCLKNMPKEVFTGIKDWN